MSIEMAVAVRNARWGVALSQVQMGHWTPDFFRQRVAAYDADFREALLKEWGAAPYDPEAPYVD